jgi:hypothetical protein
MKTTIYIYETISSSCCGEQKHYEIEQPTDAAPLTHHPETKEPIRRVVVGGVELKKSPNSTEGNSCGCGPSGCC